MGRARPGALIAGVSNLALLALLVLPGAARAAEDTAPPAGVATRPSARSVTMTVPLVWNGQVLGDVTVQADPDG